MSDFITRFDITQVQSTKLSNSLVGLAGSFEKFIENNTENLNKLPIR